MHVSVINMTEGAHLVPDAEVLRVVRAINRQIREDFAPYWEATGELRLEPRGAAEADEDQATTSLRGDAVLYLCTMKNADDVAGYHDRNHAGVPFGFVFVDVSDRVEAGSRTLASTPHVFARSKKGVSSRSSWTITLSHEALELVADPNANLLAKGPHPDPNENQRTVFHWVEVCDAVQDESYEIDGVLVSNFLLPSYYSPSDAAHGRNDFLGTTTRAKRARKQQTIAPFSVNPGGYAGFFDPKKDDDDEFDAPDARAKERRKLKAGIPTGFRRKDRRKSSTPLMLDLSGAASTDVPRAQPRFESFAVFVKKGSPKAVESVLSITYETGFGRAPKKREIEQLAPSRYLFLPSEGANLTAKEAWERAHAMRDVSGVLFAEPLFDIALEPPPPQHLPRASGGDAANRPGTEDPFWAIKQTRFDEAWLVEPTLGEGILIGHPDTGIHEHAEVPRSAEARGTNFMEPNTKPIDPLNESFIPLTTMPGHGTATISVLTSPAGKQLPGADAGVEGIAKNVSYLSYRVHNSVIHLSMTNLTRALHQAVVDGCHVISMSLGGPIPWTAARDAIKVAIDNGLIVCAAAGNYVRVVSFPAAWDEVIAVAGTNILEDKWSGSCFGSAVDLSAPAESVWVADFDVKNGKVPINKRGNGTSFAAPHVAGAAALWLKHHGRDALLAVAKPSVQALFQSVVKQTARPVLPAGFGAGILDAHAVLLADVGISPSVRARHLKQRQKKGAAKKSRGLRYGEPEAPSSDHHRDALANILGVSRDSLDARLAPLLPEGKSLNDVLAQAGDELAFHVGLDSTLRDLVDAHHVSSDEGRLHPRARLASLASSALH